MNHSPSIKPKRARGYALLVTLVMLALLSVILSAMARRSADTAIAASDAEQAMRDRWARASTTQTLLVTAPARFNARIEDWRDQDTSEGGAAFSAADFRSESVQLSLTGVDVWCRIDDEQSKINLNERLSASADALIMPQAVVNSALRPIRSGDPQLTNPAFIETLGFSPLASWGQVLPGFSPTQLLGISRPEQLVAPSRTQSAVAKATLWGDGRLNVMSASDQAIRELLEDRVDRETTALLLRLRTQKPALGLPALITNATAERGDDRRVLSSVLTGRSETYAMWLAVRPADRADTYASWSLKVLTSPYQEEREAGRIQVYHW